MEIHSFLGILAQKSFTGPGDAPDGQVLAFQVPVWSEVVETGIKSFVFLLGINSLLRILAQKSFPGPWDAPDGQILPIYGTSVVQGG